MNNCVRLAAFCCCCLLTCAGADEPLKGGDARQVPQQVAEPINPSFRNPFTRIRNMIFPETDYVFAIMGTGHAGFVYSAVVVTEDSGGYRCEDRILNIEAAIGPDGRLSATKLASLKVVSRSKRIDPEIIGILKAELESQVAMASYLPRHSPVIPCDGYSYEVYCGNEAAVIWPLPAPMLTSPESISNALNQINASDNPSEHPRWNQIRTFLEARKAGKNPSPFVPQPPPVRIKEADLPPL